MGDEVCEEKCKQCRSEIPAGAALCSKCNSYQDWRGGFSVSTTILALLTALLSVIGATAPAIYNLIHTPKSNLSLQASTIEGTVIRFVAVNSGDASGAFVRAEVGGDFLPPGTKVRIRDNSQAILPPGTRILTLDVIPQLSEEQSYAAYLKASVALVSKESGALGVIRVLLVQADGTLFQHILVLDAESMMSLMRGNADRCSALQHPNFENGCIGLAEEATPRTNDGPSAKPNRKSK